MVIAVIILLGLHVCPRFLLIFLLEICLDGLAVEAASQKPPHFIHTVWRFTSEVYETRGTNYCKQPIKFLLAKPFSFLPQLSFVGVFPSPGNTIYQIVLVCFRCYLLCKATSLVLNCFDLQIGVTTPPLLWF